MLRADLAALLWPDIDQGRGSLTASEIDRSNPITDGLAFAVDWAGSGVISLVDRTAPTFAGAYNGNANPDSAPGANAVKLTTGYVWPTPTQLVTSNGAYTGDFTLLSFSAPAVSSQRGALISSATFGGDQCYLFSNTNSTYSGSSGRLAFGGFPMGWVEYQDGIDGKLHVFVGLREGSVGYLDIDGEQVATATVGTQSVGNATAAIATEGIAGYSGYTDPTTPHVLTLAWNRALTIAERMSVGRNPRQVLRPQGSDIWWQRGAIVPSSLNVAASNITSSGARATVTLVI